MKTITINTNKTTTTEIETIKERLLKNTKDITVIYEIAANEAKEVETLTYIMKNLNGKYFTKNITGCELLSDEEFEVRKMDIIKEILRNKNLNMSVIKIINIYINKFFNNDLFKNLFFKNYIYSNLNSLILVYLKNINKYDDKTLLNIFKYIKKAKELDSESGIYNLFLKLYIILKNKNIITEEEKDNMLDSCIIFISINEIMEKNMINEEILKDYKRITKRPNFKEKEEIIAYFNF